MASRFDGNLIKQKDGFGAVGFTLASVILGAPLMTAPKPFASIQMTQEDIALVQLYGLIRATLSTR